MRLLCLCLCLFLITASVLLGPAAAQIPGLTQPPAEEEEPADPFGRTSPQSLSLQLVDVLASGEYERAAPYLDLGAMDQDARPEAAAELAVQLERLLDGGGRLIPPLQLNATSAGRVDDGLAEDTERIGSLPAASEDGEPVPLLAERVERGGRQVWVVSAETLALVPTLVQDVSAPWIDDALPGWMQRARIGGAPLAQWVALGLVALASFVALRALFWGVGLLIRSTWRDDGARPLRRSVLAALGPLSLFGAVVVASIIAARIGVGIVARAQFARGVEIVAILSLVWLVWKLIDVFAEIGTERMARRRRARAIAATVFAKRAVKAVVAIFGVLTILGAIGVNVATGVAALGLGGLAIALGAQKAVENLIGGLSIIADEPIRPGDYCRIGSVEGTVEDIGLRSTRIRTLARTVVTIPNGQLSSLEIENYAARDRFWFSPTLGLRYETTPDQVRYLLVELRALLYKHPKVISDGARVRFTGLGADKLTLEFFAYVAVTDIADYLEVQEDLMLRIMDVVGEAGVGFAFPSQTVYLTRDQKADDAKAKAAEDAVRRWRQEDELPLPRFSEAKVTALEGTIDWPPLGSVARRSADDERTPPQEPRVGSQRRRRFLR